MKLLYVEPGIKKNRFKEELMHESTAWGSVVNWAYHGQVEPLLRKLLTDNNKRYQFSSKIVFFFTSFQIMCYHSVLLKYKDDCWVALLEV